MLGSLLVPGAAEKYGLEVGDHAIAEQIVPCWECRYCKRGSYNMCELKGMSVWGRERAYAMYQPGSVHVYITYMVVMGGGQA